MKFYLVIALLILFNKINAQEVKEFTILNRLVEKSLQPVQNFFISNSIDTISINFISADDKINNLIRANILRSINENPLSSYNLLILVNEYGTEYPRLVSFPLFGDEMYLREIKLNVNYFVQKNGNKIKSFDSFEVYSDTIKLSQIKSNELEGKEAPKLPEVSILRRLVEPAVITTATGLIVYLFFIIRSK